MKTIAIILAIALGLPASGAYADGPGPAYMELPVARPNCHEAPPWKWWACSGRGEQDRERSHRNVEVEGRGPHETQKDFEDRRDRAQRGRHSK